MDQSWVFCDFACLTYFSLLHCTCDPTLFPGPLTEPGNKVIWDNESMRAKPYIILNYSPTMYTSGVVLSTETYLQSPSSYRSLIDQWNRIWTNVQYLLLFFLLLYFPKVIVEKKHVQYLSRSAFIMKMFKQYLVILWLLFQENDLNTHLGTEVMIIFMSPLKL